MTPLDGAMLLLELERPTGPESAGSTAGPADSPSPTQAADGPPASAASNAASTGATGSAPVAASASAAGADCTHRNRWTGRAGVVCRDCGATSLKDTGRGNGLLFVPHRFAYTKRTEPWNDTPVPPSYRWMHCRRCGEVWVGRTVTTYCCRCGQKDSTEAVR